MQFCPFKVAFANLLISILLSVNANLRVFFKSYLPQLSPPLTKAMLCQSFYKDYLIFFLGAIRFG